MDGLVQALFGRGKIHDTDASIGKACLAITLLAKFQSSMQEKCAGVNDIKPEL